MKRPGDRRIVVLAMALVGCQATVRPINLPPPEAVTTLGPGDVFTLHIQGEENLPAEYTVAPDGTVDVPYIDRIGVAGLEPQQVSSLVKRRLVAAKIRHNPSVSVAVKAYASKTVAVSGEVKKSDSFSFEAGMTFVRLISKAGGLTPLAKRRGIILRRKLKGGKVKAVVVDYDAITQNRIPDIPLQAGDTVYVPQRVF